MRSGRAIGQRSRALKRRSRPRMSLAILLEQVSRVHFSIDLCRRQRCVAQELLDGAEISAPCEKMGGEGMPERMGCCRVGKAQGAAQALEQELDVAGIEGAAAHAAEERLVGG